MATIVKQNVSFAYLELTITERLLL